MEETRNPPSPSTFSGVVSPALFGSDLETCQVLPGLGACLSYAEHCITTTYAAQIEPLVLAMNSNAPDGTPPKCAADLVAFIVRRLRDPSDAQTTFNTMVERILGAAGITVENLASLQEPAWQTVFAVIGVSSMLYEPGKGESGYFHAAQPDSAAAASIRAHEFCRRPISALLRELKAIQSPRALPDPADRTPEPLARGAAETLVLSNISLSALRATCKISACWTNSLDAHLAFDQDKRTVSVFRYPSYCAAVYKSGGQSFLAGIMRQRALPPVNPQSSASDARTFAREVLLSYRLLFAQDKKSKKLLSQLRLTNTHDSILYDNFLDDLCHMKPHKFKKKYEGAYGDVHPQSSILLASEFHFLGDRLLDLQRFGERHKPRKLFEFYRDRREPEKYYTFWAVIFFGGASVLLSFIQVGLAIGQVVLGAKQLKSGG